MSEMTALNDIYIKIKHFAMSLKIIVFCQVNLKQFYLITDTRGQGETSVRVGHTSG